MHSDNNVCSRLHLVQPYQRSCGTTVHTKTSYMFAAKHLFKHIVFVNLNDRNDPPRFLYV